MITTEREFSNACKLRGFSRLGPRHYARVYGDGLYQTICTKIREYMDIDSSYYSSGQRKSYCICIGVRSMYWEWPEDFFKPGIDGGYSPCELLNRRKERGRFQGIWPQYEMMEAGGFDALDSICTQEDLVDLWDCVETTSTGRVHDLSLVAPFFLTGNIQEAEIEISRHFIQTSEAMQSNIAYMQQNDFPYDDYEKRGNLSLDQDRWLWHLCMSRGYDQMERFLDDNYRRNMVFAERYGIAVHRDHQQRHMPEMK